MRRASVLLLWLLAGAAPATAQVAPKPESLHVVILHTNDVHGQALPRRGTWISKNDPPMVGGLARLAAYVSAEREEAKKTGEGLAVVDAGDWYQGTPEGLVDQGLGFVNALALVGYD